MDNSIPLITIGDSDADGAPIGPAEELASELDGSPRGPETTPLISDQTSTGCSIELALGLALGLPFLYGLLLLVEATKYIWIGVSIASYGLVILVAVSNLLAIGLTNRKAQVTNARRVETQAGIAVLCGIALLVAFSQFSKHLYVVYGGFSANNLGYWHWLRYGFANLFEGVFFDIPAIYNWGVSEIQPTVFWSQTLVFIFRTSLEFLIVATILGQVRQARKLRGKPLPKDHQTYLQFLFAGARGLLLLVLWAIPTVIGIGAVASDGLYMESSWLAIRLSAPVVLGAWLAWQSLRGLFNFSGRRNRLLALLGMAAGVWLFNASWPAFRGYLGF
jgi:hypothetical protein